LYGGFGQAHLINKHKVMGWMGCALDGIVRLKVKVLIVRTSNGCVDQCAWWAIAVTGHRMRWLREEPDVVTFADHESCELELRFLQANLFCFDRKRMSDLRKLSVSDL
jgi:hypothetical protein